MSTSTFFRLRVRAPRTFITPDVRSWWRSRIWIGIWLVPRVKALDLQNRLGFVVTLGRQVAERTNTAETLKAKETALERSRLVREDVFGRTTMTEAEKRRLRVNRPPEATHWNVLSTLVAEHLTPCSLISRSRGAPSYAVLGLMALSR